MPQLDLQINRDLKQNCVEVAIIQEPALELMEELKTLLIQLINEFNQMQIHIHIKDELNIGLIELFISLKNSTPKKVLISLDASDEITAPVKNAQLFNIFEKN